MRSRSEVNVREAPNLSVSATCLCTRGDSRTRVDAHQHVPTPVHTVPTPEQNLGCRFGIRTDSVEGRIRTDSGGFREVSAPETNP